MTSHHDLDPAGHGAGRVAPAGSGEEVRIGSFTVLYDAGCPICRAAGRWLRGRAQLVPLEFVPAGSPEARERFAGLDHDATLRDITVIGDDGSVYVGDGAWVACLWALADYRAMAERISSPALLPSARKFIAAVSAVREATRSSAGEATRSSVGEGRPDWALDYGDGCDDRCR
ncbi:thiol-disulfide oxidoreductase DCC family protein [Actinoplanes sp. NPDC000266]